MEKIKEKIEKGERLFTHRIDSCRFKPGDHIYGYRGFGSYSHHGIYVGEDCAIHFIPTESDGLSKQDPPCPKCGYQHNVHLGVVKTCLDCFLSNGALSSDSLCLYQYEESELVKMLKRSGSCSSSKCLPPQTVVNIANELHKENCFGRYDLVGNNCEDFSTFCKTGIRRSEQVLSVMNLPMMPFLAKVLESLKLSLPK
ncbi:hypothetical protein POUND7_000416 [Theobroma cacao]